MKNNIKKTVANDIEMDNFAINLFNSLKEYGYVLPKTEADVEKFEALYGNTEIETPVVKLPNSNGDVDNTSLSFDFKMAAYSASTKSGFILPEDLVEKKTTNRKKKK